MKATYNQIFLDSMLLEGVPVKTGEGGMPVSAAAAVLLQRVAYRKKLNEYEQQCAEVLAELRKEERFANLDESTQNVDEEQQKLRDELTDAFMQARTRKSLDETEVECPALTRSDLEQIIASVGTEGEITLHSPQGEVKCPKVDFLTMLTDYFIRQSS